MSHSVSHENVSSFFACKKKSTDKHFCIHKNPVTYSVVLTYLASISVKLELSRQSTKTWKRAVSQLSPVSARSARSPRTVSTCHHGCGAGAPRDGIRNPSSHLVRSETRLYKISHCERGFACLLFTSCERD